MVFHPEKPTGNALDIHRLGLDVALQMWLRAVKRDIRISLAAPRWQSSYWNEFDKEISGGWWFQT
jgi:hypothetical protein